eukprot:11104061-Alexandrium_andersonii.AAC.1
MCAHVCVGARAYSDRVGTESGPAALSELPATRPPSSHTDNPVQCLLCVGGASWEACHQLQTLDALRSLGH